MSGVIAATAAPINPRSATNRRASSSALTLVSPEPPITHSLPHIQASLCSAADDAAMGSHRAAASWRFQMTPAIRLPTATVESDTRSLEWPEQPARPRARVHGDGSGVGGRKRYLGVL